MSEHLMRRKEEEKEYIKGLRERLKQVGEKAATIRDERMKLLEDVHIGNKAAMKNLRDCIERLQQAQQEEEEVFLDLADAMEKDHPELME
ncbi:hypothetical protein KKD80_02795 [Patescibacteria group bacterium]|nr:hypothetical protein [Patescibacteria group bacterium]